MFKDFSLGQYIPGDSFLHRRDPRSKLAVVFFYAIIIFILPNLPTVSLAGVFLLAAVLVSGLPFTYILKGLKPLWFLALFTLIAHLFGKEGTVLFNLGPFKATLEGLLHGFLVTLRLVLLVAATTLLTLTTSPIALTDGVESILRPFRRIGVPAHELALMMTIALRFIPTLLEEADKIMKAQMARGADFEGGGLIKRAKSIVPLLVPLLVNALRRAEDLALAMEARCYRGGSGRTRYRQLQFALSDYALVFSSLVLFGLAIGYRWVV